MEIYGYVFMRGSKPNKKSVNDVNLNRYSVTVYSAKASTSFCENSFTTKYLKMKNNPNGHASPGKSDGRSNQKGSELDPKKQMGNNSQPMKKGNEHSEEDPEEMEEGTTLKEGKEEKSGKKAEGHDSKKKH